MELKRRCAHLCICCEEKELFLELCEEFLKYQKEHEKNITFAKNDDLSILYRFINKFGWDIINRKK